MNSLQIKQFITRYLSATQCQIIEKTPESLLVKLSPLADRALTNRPYYWSFVERTGAEAETLTIRFNFEEPNELPFDKESAQSQAQRVQTPPLSFGQRIPEEKMYYGSAMVKQIFQHCRTNGKYVELYENTKAEPSTHLSRQAAYGFATPLTSWLGVNYKVEYICDMKKDEIYSLGMNLSTGEIVENFYSLICNKQLMPKMPTQTHLRETISLTRAAVDLEKYIEKKLIIGDHEWASLAMERYRDEVQRVETYYKQMQNDDEPSESDENHTWQLHNKLKEIEQQYRPKITVNVINCGIFHLLDESFRQTK